MSIDYKKLLNELLGQAVERPNKATAGTLSGHAAGEPFEKLVYSILKKEYGNAVFKQYEFLNDLYLKHPKVISVQDRRDLIESPTALFLLSRGDAATKSWTPSNVFEEKQSDTADILFHQTGYYELIDVKTHNRGKKSQPPNIISSYKLAQMCTYMIDNKEYDAIGLHYIGIEWAEAGDKLQCTGTCYADMFKAHPDSLYINWAAGLQIQQHVADFDQTWTGKKEAWAVEYLKTFVESAKRRCKKMEEDYIKPFLPYINN